MREDETGTIRTLTAYREVMTTLIKQHHGRVVDTVGDNLLAEFASVVDAVQGAVAIQKEIKSRNAQMPESRRMLFRIGRAELLLQSPNHFLAILDGISYE